MIATVGAGSATASSFSNSSAMRSRERAMRSFARRVHASNAAGVGIAGAEPSMEAEEAEDTQMIFGDALQRVADEADVPATKIVETAEIIEDLAGPRIGGQGVDGEVAACGVGLPVIGKRDRRPAAVGRHVAPQRRHFDGMAVTHCGDRAMIDPGRNRLDAHLLEPLDDFLGTQARRKVDVVDRQSPADRRVQRRRRSASVPRSAPSASSTRAMPRIARHFAGSSFSSIAACARD